MRELERENEVHSSELISDPALPSVTGLNLEAVYEIDYVVEPATGTGADATSGDGQMGLAGASPADHHSVALLGDEAAASKVIHERLIDRGALELEVIEVLGERQLGDGELVLNRARLLLVDLGVEQINVRRSRGAFPSFDASN
jgi:hypothetical protein